MNCFLLACHDCNTPYLFIDAQAPIDVLHDAAAYRIRAVTQLLENFVGSDEVRSPPYPDGRLSTCLVRDWKSLVGRDKRPLILDFCSGNFDQVEFR
ncbi:hypothetical protein [Pseudomonas sp. Fl5BN2]|uniref:hypothetical protein n=1 Tax=Pseudomonas sp. Fl5BN2 TaxID=2697652 RepID=UPI003DAA1AAD